MSSDESLEILSGPPEGWLGRLQWGLMGSRFGTFWGETSRPCPDLTGGPTSGASDPTDLTMWIHIYWSLVHYDHEPSSYEVPFERLTKIERAAKKLLDDCVAETGPFKSKSIIDGPRRNVGSRIVSMANAAMRALGAAQAQLALIGVLANEEVARVHSRINFNWHLRVVEQQCLQQAAFMKYLWGTVVSHFSEIWDANETLEGEVSGLKASIELVGKELKSYKAQNETLKTVKDKAEKSNTGLRTELKKVREDLAVRTAEVEVVKKEANDLRAKIAKMQKTGSSSSGIGKHEVTTLIKKNLARHQAKWEEEKTKLVALEANLVKRSFENALAQVRLKNPGLNLDGMSHEFEVLHGHICRVDTEARKLYDVDTGDEVADWDEDGEFRKGS
ncbi:hypothetical protein SESBI_05549 [Sesbania bispinosa]|nr:hypothetical protein SESBI_05549 [Sesbania bispinosa]